MGRIGQLHRRRLSRHLSTACANKEITNSNLNSSETQTQHYNAWKPGLSSTIPAALEPRITLFQDENSHVSFAQAKELADFCGLQTGDLISFRVDRLIAHELLIRVTSDLSVPDGPNYEDLGINLRSMVATIHVEHAKPELERIEKAVSSDRAKASTWIDLQISTLLFPDTQKEQADQSGTWWQRLLRSKSEQKKATPNDHPEINAVNQWEAQYEQENTVLYQHCLKALIKTVNAIVAHRGRIINDPALIRKIAVNMAANHFAQERVAELITPIFDKAVAHEGFVVLPTQKKPVVMNVKGASASGKSTIRPKQQLLAERLGIPWEDFALVSPDYWRKYLLDYESLGDDYKYAAMLTGQELEIIDKKLDRYMAKKASLNQVPHLLVDRFRFDSFTVEDGGSEDTNLLSRFADQIYLFFMITPPAETVVRAWQRGLTTGRYKAVDDLLFHNIEAYTGMPALFLSWVHSSDKRVHFEFLNNDVPKGEVPRTIAFGWNDSMTILDATVLSDIDLFRQVNVNADNAEDVLRPVSVKPKQQELFLQRCISTIKTVRFANATTAEVSVLFEEGALQFFDTDKLADRQTENLIRTFSEPDNTSNQVAAKTSNSALPPSSKSDYARFVAEAKEQQYTLGRWV